MYRRLSLLLVLALTLASAPALAAAASPNGPHHSEPRASLNWQAYPSDIQAMKAQLDQIRDRQKELFHQMKDQHKKLKEARNAMSAEQKQSLMAKAKPLIQQMKSSRDAIRSLRDQKHDAWDNFQKHAEGKQWTTAKADLQTIVKQKQDIVQNQEQILKVQKQILELMSPSSSAHIHTEE